MCHSHLSTAGQQSGGSAAAVDDPAQKCTARSSTNDSKGKKVVVPSEATTTKVNLSNYDEDGYPEAPHFTLVLLEEKQAYETYGTLI